MISAQIQTIAFFLRTFLSSFIPKWNSYSYHELLSKKKKKKKNHHSRTGRKCLELEFH